MKTCFVVHNPAAARALRSHVGPDGRVVTPPGCLGGFAIERLVVLDAPGDEVATPDGWDRYREWYREVIVPRLVPGAKLVNMPSLE